MSVFKINDIKKGAIDSLPIVISVFPFGIIYGVLAIKAGFTIFEASFSSVVVFAGAAQLCSLPLFAAEVSPWAIIGTTFIINLRHFIMGASISRKIKEDELMPRLLASYVLVDESFAITSAWWDKAKRESARDYFIGSGIALWTSWNISTITGSVFGNFLGDPKKLGIDFAIAAGFIGLLVPLVKGRVEFLVLLVAIIASILSYLFIPGSWYILIATLCASIIGALLSHDDEIE
jgi:branched chain amino acid efflux pump